MDAPDCYDAIVLARVVRQVPSVLPECGKDCIVMVWPWFVDLKILGVLKGKARLGTVRTQSILHVQYRSNLGVKRWAIRRNSLGSYNLHRLGQDQSLKRCSSALGVEPAYLEPKEGQTLDDLYRAGAERYREMTGAD
jgi:hypothetical protein